MAQVNHTLDSEFLKGLFTADGKDAALVGLLSIILNQVLNAQASGQIGAEPYERSEDRRSCPAARSSKPHTSIDSAMMRQIRHYLSRARNDSENQNDIPESAQIFWPKEFSQARCSKGSLSAGLHDSTAMPIGKKQTRSYASGTSNICAI